MTDFKNKINERICIKGDRLRIKYEYWLFSSFSLYNQKRKLRFSFNSEGTEAKIGNMPGRT